MEAEGVSRQPQVKGETHTGTQLPGGRRQWGGGGGWGHGGGTCVLGGWEPAGIDNSGGTAVCGAGRCWALGKRSQGLSSVPRTPHSTWPVPGGPLGAPGRHHLIAQIQPAGPPPRTAQTPELPCPLTCAEIPVAPNPGKSSQRCHHSLRGWGSVTRGP